MTAVADPLVDRFRTMAAKLAGDVKAKRADRRSNTPKQNLEMTRARIEGDHLERVQVALERLADAREAGTLPKLLAGIKSKAELLSMLRTRTDTSGGYYSCVDTGKYPDQSTTAQHLRNFLAEKADPVAEEARAKKKKLEELDQQVKFSTIPGFFPTPPELVEQLLELADIQVGHRILEPSAGKGDIADAIRKLERGEFHVCEINFTLRSILEAKGFAVVAEDFLSYMTGLGYDRIVMNPPFEKGADMDHVRHAYGLLKTGGRVVAIMSPGGFFRNDKKATEFREWFTSVGGEKSDNQEGAFKKGFRSTGTSSVIVVLNRPEATGTLVP